MTNLAERITATDFRQRRPLQATIAILAMLPVFAGLCGVVMGAKFLGDPSTSVDLDSHLRFLSGLFLAFGIGWYSCIPAIETKTERIRILAILTFCGGLARLYSMVTVGVPSTGHILGLGIELLVVPALVIWHTKVSAAAGEGPDQA